MFIALLGTLLLACHNHRNHVLFMLHLNPQNIHLASTLARGTLRNAKFSFSIDAYSIEYYSESSLEGVITNTNTALTKRSASYNSITYSTKVKKKRNSAKQRKCRHSKCLFSIKKNWYYLICMDNRNYVSVRSASWFHHCILFVFSVSIFYVMRFYILFLIFFYA